MTSLSLMPVFLVLPLIRQTKCFSAPKPSVRKIFLGIERSISNPIGAFSFLAPKLSSAQCIDKTASVSDPSIDTSSPSSEDSFGKVLAFRKVTETPGETAQGRVSYWLGMSGSFHAVRGNDQFRGKIIFILELERDGLMKSVPQDEKR